MRTVLVVVVVPTEAESDPVAVLDGSLFGAPDGPLGAALASALDSLVAVELPASPAADATLDGGPATELAAEAVVTGGEAADERPASPAELEQAVAISAPIITPATAMMRR
ncbi:MAG: hypothetical protein ACR2P2_17125 [Nakamurella sp.]